MNQDQFTSLIRSVFKVVGGMVVAKGITDGNTAEIVISGAVALSGIIWSHYAHKQPVIPPPSTNVPVQKL